MATPYRVGLSEGFRVVMVLEQAHSGMVRNSVCGVLDNENNVLFNLEFDVFIRTSHAQVSYPQNIDIPFSIFNSVERRQLFPLFLGGMLLPPFDSISHIVMNWHMPPPCFNKNASNMENGRHNQMIDDSLINGLLGSLCV